jgi:hypothetical protein
MPAVTAVKLTAFTSSSQAVLAVDGMVLHVEPVKF